MRNTVLYTCKRTGESWFIADDAKRIAQDICPIQISSNEDRTRFDRQIWLIERRIRMAIRRAVKVERERCVGIVKANKLPTYVGSASIIKAINTPAKAMNPEPR